LDHPSITTRLKSRFVLGTYEFRERHAVAQFLDPGIPVVELGGGIGVVSCIVNKRLRHPDRHVVVEANAELVPQIERNRKINGCSFVVRHLALGYGGSVVEFSLAASYLESGVGLQGCRTVAVPASTLAGILDSQGFGQATLVCDIEGAEFGLLRHEAAVLTKRVPMIIIEGHDVPGVGSRADFKAGVLGLGFRCLSEGGRTWVFAKDPGPSPAQ
jgi:FkbM family methyltransferase